MLLRGGKARTEIRGQRSHTDPDEEVLLLNSGIFTTSLCLPCGCWQSHVHTETMCLLLLPLACGVTFWNVWFSEKPIRRILFCGLAVARTVTFGLFSALFHQCSVLKVWYKHSWLDGKCVTRWCIKTTMVFLNGFGWEWFSVRCFVTLFFFSFFFYPRFRLSEADLTWHSDRHMFMS